MIRPLVFMLSWESAERAGCDLSVRRASRTSMTDACSGFHGILFYSRKVEKAIDLLVIWLVLALTIFRAGGSLNAEAITNIMCYSILLKILNILSSIWRGERTEPQISAARGSSLFSLNFY